MIERDIRDRQYQAKSLRKLAKMNNKYTRNSGSYRRDEVRSATNPVYGLTAREIERKTSLGTNAVHRALSELRERGEIERYRDTGDGRVWLYRQITAGSDLGEVIGDE